MTQGVARIATAVVGIPLILGSIWVGGWLFYGLISIIALLGSLELCRMFGKIGWKSSPTWSVLLGIAVLSRFWIPQWDGILLGVVIVFAISTVITGTHGSLERFAATIAGAVYPVWLISYLIDIRWGAQEVMGNPEAFFLMLLLFCLIWATDTGAYYTGSSIGRHKLAPSISPNKTWEGTIGGLIVSFGVAALFKVTLLTDLTWMDAGVLALLGGVWGQLGDLLESAFKRGAGVKDSASLLPGHGGILDRFDSLIATAPAYYLYLKYATQFIGG